jgi:hypothetical protein
MYCKKWIQSFCALGLLFSLITSAACQQPTSTPDTPDSPRLLFAQTSLAAKLEPLADDAKLWKLTLINPSPVTRAFADRPFRKTFEFKATDFDDIWALRGDDNFANDPPNATLTYYGLSGIEFADPAVTADVRKQLVGDPSKPIDGAIKPLEQGSFTVILRSKPIFNDAINTIEFTVEPIINQGETGSELDALKKSRVTAIVFNHSSLFIDTFWESLFTLGGYLAPAQAPVAGGVLVFPAVAKGGAGAGAAAVSGISTAAAIGFAAAFVIVGVVGYYGWNKYCETHESSTFCGD